MAQVTLDVLYNVKGMQALKASQQTMNRAAKAANLGAGSINKFGNASGAAAPKATQLGRSAKGAAGGMKLAGAAGKTGAAGITAFGVASAKFLAPLIGITAAIGGLSKAFQLAGSREAELAALTNGLQKIGAEAGSLDSLKKSAEELGRATLFSKDQFQEGFTLLTSFQNIGLKSFEEVSMAAADMAQVTGQDLNSSLLQLSKALQDPARGLSYLSRAGTTFTQQQQEQIKAMQQSGNLMGAQKLILAEITKQYGGAAKAAGEEGLAGAFDSLMQTLGNAGEYIGRALTPLAGPMLEGANQAVKTLMEYWDWLGANIMPIVQQSFTRLQEILKPVFQSFKDIEGAVDWELLGALMKAGVWTVLKLIEGAVTVLVTKFRVFKKLLESITNLPGFKILQKIWGFIADQIKRATGTTQEFVAETQNAVKPVSELKQNADEIKKPIESAKDEMKGLKDKTGEAKDKAKELKQEMTNADTSIKGTNATMSVLKSILDALVSIQKSLNDALGKGKGEAGGLADNEQRAAMNAERLRQNQSGANAEISRGKAEAAGLASNLQSAAAAMASMGSGTSVNYGPQLYDAYTWDSEKGAPRKTTAKEREEQVLRQKMSYTNQKQKEIQAWDKAFAGTDYSGRADAVWKNGGMIGLPGSQMYNEFMNKYGSWLPERRPDMNRLGAGYAEGGFITHDHIARVGEGGEPEYIIPASKMDGAMQRYGAGVRGSGVIDGGSVTNNLQFNGSTISFNDDQYMRVSDAKGLINQATQNTLTTLQRSSRARLNSGLR